MRKNMIIISYIIYLPVLLCLFACNKMVETNIPVDRITRDAVFTSDATATAAINGVYSTMIQSNQQFGSGGITLFAALSADELKSGTTSAAINEFADNELTSANQLIRSNLWSAAYQVIFQCNNIIEGLEQSNAVSAGAKQQLTGEAKFVRAFCYFYLLNLYGDVPLVVTTDYRSSAVLPRNSATEVYRQIVDDLTTAKTLMTDQYPVTSRVRPNRFAAAALLARVHLFRGEWQQAETEASEVIASTSYSLVPNLNNVFLPASSETIWQLMPVSSGVNTWDGNNFIPASNVVPSFFIDPSLLTTFEAGDQRKTSWTKSMTVASNSYTYPYKYKIKTATALSEYYVVLRLAEQYLVRAEARIQQNKTSLALGDINAIRSRAGLPSINTTDVALLLTATNKERQVELFAEWGHRWFDLKRTGRANMLLSYKPTWQATDTLYPIPVIEIQRNPFLHQNPGY